MNCCFFSFSQKLILTLFFLQSFFLNIIASGEHNIPELGLMPSQSSIFNASFESESHNIISEVPKGDGLNGTKTSLGDGLNGTKTSLLTKIMNEKNNKMPKLTPPDSFSLSGSSTLNKPKSSYDMPILKSEMTPYEKNLNPEESGMKSSCKVEQNNTRFWRSLIFFCANRSL